MNADTDTFPAYIPIDPRSPDPDFRPGAVWTQAKADYLAGESAPRVCQRYELALSTFRTRMRVEGWRRCDQIEDVAEPRELDPAPPTPELVDLAWRAMADALKRGRAYEARAFMRLTHDLRAEVSREEAIVQHQAWKAAQTGTSDPVLHGLHAGLDSAAAPSPSAHPRAGGDPVEAGVAANHDLLPKQMNPLGPRLRGDERGGCEQSPEQEVGPDTATPDPVLHGLHARSHSAAEAELNAPPPYLTLPGVGLRRPSGVPGIHPLDVQPGETAGYGPLARGRGKRSGGNEWPDTATSDPDLYRLHSKSDSADLRPKEPASGSGVVGAWAPG